MTCLCNVVINGGPDKFVEQYIVARCVKNTLQYYGQYNYERAQQVARELGESSVVIRRYSTSTEINYTII